MKPKLSPEGRKILNKALRAILAMPETYNQGHWLRHNPLAPPSRRRPAPYCGTEACLAGHIVLASGEDAPYVSSDHALSLLGIPPSKRPQAGNALFNGNRAGWPERFIQGWSRLTKAEKATRVVARVRYWLRTGN